MFDCYLLVRILIIADFSFLFRLKGLGPEQTAETIEETLNHVNLAAVRRNPVSSFSGGMKVGVVFIL